jgi:hypothetical protein
MLTPMHMLLAIMFVSADFAFGDHSTSIINGPNCTFDEFACNDGKCIPNQSVCDHMVDCSDGNDEIDCNDKNPSLIDQAGQLCRLDEFTCNDGKCISMNWICDGNDDCSDGYDEISCNSNCGSIGSYCDHFCSQNQCQCYSGYQLINLYECVRFNETYLYSSAFGNKFTMTILVYLLILNIII